MPRVKGGTVTRKRRKKILKLAKGYFGSKHALYRTAHEQVMRSLQYAYRDRKQRKREFRKLWIVRINAACKLNDFKYSLFINGLIKSNVEVNRKMLADIAVNDPEGFKAYVEIAKKGLNLKPAPKKAVVIEQKPIKEVKAAPKKEAVKEVKVAVTEEVKTPKKESVKTAPAAKKVEASKEFFIEVLDADGKKIKKVVNEEDYALTSMNLVSLKEISMSLGLVKVAKLKKMELIEAIIDARSKGVEEQPLNLIHEDKIRDMATAAGIKDAEHISKAKLVKDLAAITPEKEICDEVACHTKESLTGMVVVSLRDIANRLGVADYLKLRKAELIAAILESQKAGTIEQPLNKLLVADLRERAFKAGIENATKMKKNELIEALEKNTK